MAILLHDPQATPKIELLEEKYVPLTAPVTTPFVVYCGLALLGVVATGSVLGAAPFALLVVVGQALTLKNRKPHIAFLRKHDGCFAHLISQERDMVDYIKHHGKNEVARQLALAVEAGLPLTNVAWDVYEQSVPKEERPVIDVKSVLSLPPQSGSNESLETSERNGSKVLKDVVTAFLEDLRCTVLCAPPRTGKGVVASGFMIGFKTMFSGGKLFSCTIKQFSGEDWFFEPSDAHINPDRRDAITLAKQLYALYRAWESSDSNVQNPSLLVIDEIRDTLLALANVKSEDIDPELAETFPKFSDWLKAELISAATLNQCHGRYVLLISPVSTASAMGFKDANSLNSYASFTLATPNELGFTEGNNGTFSAPTISKDDPLFNGVYALAWSKKAKAWLSVPKLDPEVLKQRETNPPKLTYFSQGTIRHVTVETPSSPVLPVEESSELDGAYETALGAIGSDWVTLPKLGIPERLLRRVKVDLIEALKETPEIEYEAVKRGAVVSHKFRLTTDNGQQTADNDGQTR